MKNNIITVTNSDIYKCMGQHVEHKITDEEDFAKRLKLLWSLTDDSAMNFVFA